MFLQILTNTLLDDVGVLVGNDVHGGVIALTVHASDVDVMNIHDTLDFGNMLPDFFDGDSFGIFFKKTDPKLPLDFSRN